MVDLANRRGARTESRHVRVEGSRGAAGFTLVEAVITMVVVIGGLLATMSTFMVSHRLKESTRQRRLATDAIQTTADELVAFSTQAAAGTQEWSSTVAGAYSLDGLVGASFPIQGLEPWAPDDPVMTVLVVTDETVQDAEFGVRAGLPRDLDGDGEATNVDVRGRAKLLPALLRVRWAGVTGRREISRVIYLHGYR